MAGGSHRWQVAGEMHISGETGELAGGIHFGVPGDGNGHREFWTRHFSHRVLAPGFRRLKAGRLTPERPTSGAATRHLE